MKTLTVLLFLFSTLTALGDPGTMSTDDTHASQAEASLSGFRTGDLTDEIQKEEEERPWLDEKESQECVAPSVKKEDEE
jgi:hypothetical protein